MKNIISESHLHTESEHVRYQRISNTSYHKSFDRAIMQPHLLIIGLVLAACSHITAFPTVYKAAVCLAPTDPDVDNLLTKECDRDKGKACGHTGAITCAGTYLSEFPRSCYGIKGDYRVLHTGPDRDEAERIACEAHF